MAGRIKGRAVVWLALGVLLLRLGAGPVILGTQLLIGGVAPDSECGNAALRFPNTDLLSWWISHRTAAAFDDACLTHDRCYNTLGRSKAACDRALLAELRAGCQQVYRTLDSSPLLAWIGEGACRLEAETYWVGVSLPPVQIAYCTEQHYARVGSRDRRPDLPSLLRECQSGR